MDLGWVAEPAAAAAVAVPVWAAARRLETRARRRAGRVSRGDRATSTVSSRHATVDVVYELACAHLGHTPPKPPTPRTNRPTGQRARKGMLDSLIDGAVDGLVGRAEHAVETRTARNADVNRVVKVHGWQTDGTPARATVTFPAGADTAPGSKARTLWEAGWVERFGAGWVFRFDWPANRTVVEMTPVRRRRPLPEHVAWQHDPNRPWNLFTLGEGEAGPVRWNVLHHPHGLSGGKTRSGKTAALRARTLEALLSGWEVYVCDPKGVDFAWCARWDTDDRITHLRAGVKAVGVETGDIVNVLTLVVDEMGARRRAMRRAGAVNYPQWRTICEQSGVSVPPPVLVDIDEAAVFIGKGQDDLEKSLRERAQAAAGLIAAQGAGLGVFLDLATQFPYADILNRWRGNLDAAIAVGSLRRTESVLVLGSGSAEGTSPVRADGVTPLPGRAVVRLGYEVTVQLAYVSDEDIERWAPPFHPVADDAPRPVRRPAAPLLVPVPDDEDPDMDEPDPDAEVADAETVVLGGDQLAAGIVRAW